MGSKNCGCGKRCSRNPDIRTEPFEVPAGTGCPDDWSVHPESGNWPDAKHAHQRHAGALASGKHANALVYVIPPEQETAKQIPDHGRRFPRGGSFHAFQNRFIRIQIISMRLGEKATCVWRPMVTLPELGASPPEIRRENVDFPAPFTPTMAMRSPLTISKSTFSKRKRNHNVWKPFPA